MHFSTISLKISPQYAGILKASSSNLAKGCTIRYSLYKSNVTKPAVCKVKGQFLFQSSLRLDPIEISDPHHCYQNNGIDRVSSNKRRIGRFFFLYKIKIYTMFNLSKQMILHNHEIYIQRLPVTFVQCFSCSRICPSYWTFSGNNSS